MVYLWSISGGGFMMLPITFCTVMVVTLVGWTALRMKAQDPGLGTLAWGGIKVSLITTIYGLLVLPGSSLSWFGLRQ